ncbi:MAG TPA: DUF2017 family protein [Jatrophihabitantaceae bacterium]|nr:DUF2017 family protein [Jatrophihabitantaceae bacterium]
MKVSRRSGQVRVRLETSEVELLSQVLLEFEQTSAVLAPGDLVYERLHPAAYQDPDAAAEFRDLTGDDADRARAARVGQCRAELTGTTLRLDDESLERWLMTLNDLRLALGTRLGVTAEEDPNDPAVQGDGGRLLYHWLTWFQDALVLTVLR